MDSYNERLGKVMGAWVEERLAAAPVRVPAQCVRGRVNLTANSSSLSPAAGQSGWPLGLNDR
jgi:hypothetical protein